MSEFLDSPNGILTVHVVAPSFAAISLCSPDIATAVMTLGRFRVASRVGHMERLKRI
jgi:hypothetical protein